jgi:hypothetical protein
MGRRILHKILALFFIFIFPIVITMCGGGNRSGLSTHSISGRITSSDGVGLSGVTVVLAGVYAGCSGTQSTSTDSSGYYSFTTDYLYSGSGTLTPYLEGYIFTPTSRSISSVGNSDVWGQSFMATPLPHSISGKVMTASGTGIAGNTVKLSGTADATTVTDANGAYTFTGLLKGYYTVEPSQSTSGYSFTPPKRTVNIDNKDVSSQDFTITTYIISGRVVNNNGIGFSGVNVTLSGTESLSTTSDASGNYSFITFQPGLYTITPSMSAPGYTFTPSERTVEITTGDIAGQDFSTLAYAISGRVSTSTGAGVSGITLSLNGQSSFSSTSDANGNYAFAVIQSGTYTITPSATCNDYSFIPVDITAAISASDITGQNFTAAIISHSVSGRVTALDGSAAPGVLVNLSGDVSALTTTDANGYYAFDGVQHGYFTITPSSPEYTFLPTRHNVNVCGADITGQDFAESVSWTKTYGQGILYSIQTTSDNGYIASGSSYGMLQIIKLHPNGSIHWQKSYGQGVAASISETSDSGFIVTGSTSALGVGNDDLWVLKLDANGTIMWQNAYGGTGADRGNSIFQTTDGGFVVAGTYEADPGVSEIWVLRLDANGAIVWQKSYGTGWISSIRQTSDGGYIAAGSHVMKIDTTGNMVWKKSYQGSANFIEQTSDGGYIAAGGTTFSAGSSDLWVLKLTADGSVIWQNAYGESYDEIAQSVRPTSDGGYIIAGNVAPDPNDAFVILLKLDSNGNISWQKRYGSWPLRHWAYSLAITADGGYILGGSGSYFGTSSLVLRIDSNGTGCSTLGSNLTMTLATALPVDFSDPATDTDAVKTVTTSVPNNTSLTTSQVCPVP